MSDPLVSRVEYVGKKPFAVDTVAGTGVCWNGKGDIQLVPADKAEKLAKYPDQWRILDGEQSTAAATAATLEALKELGADPKTAETPAANLVGAVAALADVAKAEAQAQPKSNRGKKKQQKAAAPESTEPGKGDDGFEV